MRLVGIADRRAPPARSAAARSAIIPLARLIRTPRLMSRKLDPSALSLCCRVRRLTLSLPAMTSRSISALPTIGTTQRRHRVRHRLRQRLMPVVGDHLGEGQDRRRLQRLPRQGQPLRGKHHAERVGAAANRNLERILQRAMRRIGGRGEVQRDRPCRGAGIAPHEVDHRHQDVERMMVDAQAARGDVVERPGCLARRLPKPKDGGVALQRAEAAEAPDARRPSVGAAEREVHEGP